MAQMVIGSIDDFTENEPKQVTCAIGTLCVIRTAAGFRVLDDECTHETASLADGEYYDDTDEVECPLHQSTFDCSTGASNAPPATAAVTVYTATVSGNDLTITT